MQALLYWMITIIKLYKQVFGMKIYQYVKCFDWYHRYNKNKQPLKYLF